MGLEARQAAIRTLDAVLREKRMLAHVPADTRLVPADQARAGRLVSLVLRHLDPLDACIAPYLDRKPPLPALLLLRLAAAELLVAGEDAHGVVDSAVTMAKRNKGTVRMAGMINAVLRKVAVEGPERFADLPPQALPDWIGGPVRKRWGKDVLHAIEAAHMPLPPIDLTVKPGVTLDLPHATQLPTGSLRFSAGTQITALPGYEDGTFWVQDAAAALPVRLLGDVAGARVLDMCAAPGGKTMQLAALGAQVTALDLSQSRMDRVAQNLARTGLSADLIVEDAFDHAGGPYDAILLDAPCSATGTIRRHPDLPHVKDRTEVEPLTRLQMRMFDHALTLLKPGGRLVFCTCSLLPVEGEFQVTAALKRHEGLRVIPADAVALGGEASWQGPEGGLRLRPDFWADIGGIDGFYMAALTRM
ncbi:RsmB/NOP family class I SAM-dependent RNA methyltransferase [Roseicyclus mahoneyensis]|uniref:16S rRNA (Cytosine967-C5)-methyltransferase n=1 Tax=Roseicyclus mahoneyensis TaxID=164332 RepID=A0A316GHL2_9RHOB|nr:RsmB/NOP family class I SAM-dependent RNA methyltransferase [Roseicyclus mahoneyensis]PWK60050.1 16S rRNA (cytosine967-C5)-methyltransferase [Roseicyclus mahoneyensis]